MKSMLTSLHIVLVHNHNIQYEIDGVTEANADQLDLD
jgi:hypothetical protein